MKLVLLVGLVVALFIWVVIAWIKGIDYMQEHHPDYKGLDLFGEDEEENQSIINPELYNKINKKDLKITNKIQTYEPPFKKFKKWLRNLFS